MSRYDDTNTVYVRLLFSYTRRKDNFAYQPLLLLAITFFFLRVFFFFRMYLKISLAFIFIVICITSFSSPLALLNKCLCRRDFIFTFILQIFKVHIYGLCASSSKSYFHFLDAMNHFGLESFDVAICRWGYTRRYSCVDGTGKFIPAALIHIKGWG